MTKLTDKQKLEWLTRKIKWIDSTDKTKKLDLLIDMNIELPSEPNEMIKESIKELDYLIDGFYSELWMEYANLDIDDKKLTEDDHEYCGMWIEEIFSEWRIKRIIICIEFIKQKINSCKCE